MTKAIKIISISILVFLVLNIFISQPNRIKNIFADDQAFKQVQELNSSAKAMFLFEANSGREIYAKNCEDKLALASTTKIITAITALENYKGDLDEKIQIPDEAVGLEGTSMYLKYGEEVSIRELLFGLMLPSGNDAGKALAIITSGSEKKFCELMNQVAIKAGAENSNFVNAHGLDADGHYTTAKDLAKITAYALNNKIFKQIVSTKNVVIEQTNKYQTRYYKNKNRLLFELDDCIGVKTGFTDNAGRCLVSATDSDNLRLVCVVLNCPDMFEECSRLIKKAKSDYKSYEIVNQNNCIDTISVHNGNINEVRLFAIQSFNYPLTKQEYDRLNICIDYPKEVNAPIKEQDIIGSIKVFIDDCLIFSTKICSIDNVKSLSTKDLIQEIINNWS